MSVTKRAEWTDPNRSVYTAELWPVSDGSPENKAFFEATPSGKIEVGTHKASTFEVGKEYYVDFTQAL